MAIWRLGRNQYSADASTESALEEIKAQLEARFFQYGSGAPASNLDAIWYVDTSASPPKRYYKIDGTWTAA